MHYPGCLLVCSKICNPPQLIAKKFARKIYCSKKLSSSYSPKTKELKWSYIHGVPDSPLLGITVGSLLQSKTELHPDRDAAVFYEDGQRFTFQQLLLESDKLAASLLSLGLKKGDRVGIWGPNSSEWVITQYATARAGLILTNINPLYRKNELQYALKKVGCKALIAATGFKDLDYYELLFEIIPELATASPNSIKSHILPQLTTLIMLGNEKYRGAFSFEEILNAASNSQIRKITDLQDSVQFDDPINIQFTSGTTGLPKGVTLSHHNLVNNSYNLGRRLNFHNKPGKICCPVPLYHCFGMVMACLQIPAHGATVVFSSRIFDARKALTAVAKERCTALYGVPTMFIDMLNYKDLPNLDLSSLHTGIMAGSPCPIEIMRQCIERLHMKDITVAYGSTETSPVTFQSLQDTPIEKRVSTVGVVADHVEAKVVDENGAIVRAGVSGELCTRGYTTMSGYWEDEEKTREVITNERWYCTGDLAVINSDGYCQIVGRSKDMLIRGGENIYPVEIEQVLYQHPKIRDAQVIGVPSARLGEEVCAWVQLKEGQNVSEVELKNFCQDKLAQFKIPRYFLFVETFPTTITGKVQKFKMREASVKLLGLEHVHPH